MNRGKHGRMTLSVVLVAVMALVLQGCGGDDNGVEQDLRDQIAMLEGQLSGAETAKAAADAARMTAEAAATDAMAAQTDAEAERDAANIAKGAAEQAQATAEATQMTAEEAQTAAEAAQMTAEAAQAAAVQAQAVAEAERDAATGTLSAAEMARDAAKDAEATAKVAEAEANAAKMAAEGERDDSNAAKMAADAAQAAAEMERDAANAAKMMAEEAQMDAAAGQAAAEKAAMDAAAAQATAEKAAADAMAAQMAAEKTAMDAMAAQATAEKTAMDAQAAQAAAEKAAADAKSAQTAAEMERDNYKQMLTELQGEVGDTQTVQDNAALKDLLAALMSVTDANTTTDGDQSNRAGNPTLTVPAAPSALGPTTVEATSDGMLVIKATDYDTEMPADAIDGWRGAELKGSTAGNEGDTLVLYSDIGNDGSESLLDRYMSSLPRPSAPRSWAIDNNDTDDNNDTTDVINTDNDISWTVVTRPDDTSAVSGTSTAAMVTFMGSVHNIPGTFSCPGNTTACVAPVRYSDGKVATGAGTVTGDWNFIPDEGVATYTDDTSYLAFGWWLNKGDDGKPDDVRLLMSATGLGEERAEASTSGAMLRGSATYEGGAAGKYAIASQANDSYEGGHFTAMATLTADFDVDLSTASPLENDRDGIALSGMIDNFMTGSTSRPNWTVELMADRNRNTSTDPAAVVAAAGIQPLADLGSDLVADADANVTGDQSRLTTEWSTGVAQTGTGTWTAKFYDGRAAVAPDDDTVIDNLVGNTMLPMAVVGTFNAHIGGTGAGAVGRIQGSFGANKAE